MVDIRILVEVVAVLADVVQLGVDGGVVLPPARPPTPLPRGVHAKSIATGSDSQGVRYHISVKYQKKYINFICKNISIVPLSH